MVERSIHAAPARTPPGVPVPAPSDASVPAHEPPLVLWTEGLRKQFGAVTAVRDVSLRVRQGDVFGFLGPNGSGKTTTMAIILGLIAPTAGQIALFGQTTPAGRVTALARVGAFIESPGFYPYLSGRDNLRVVSRMRHLPETRIAPALAQVRLTERADRKYGGYSLGMKQRLALAAVLLPDPDFLMLDEPTNGLDPEGVVEVRELIQGLATAGKTVFLSSHVLAEVQQVCTRVAFISHGAVVREGYTADLLRTRNEVIVEANDVQAAYTLLRAQPWVQDIGGYGRGLRVRCTGECAAQIAAIVVGAGLQLQRLQPVESSLESLYLELVGGEGMVPHG